MAKTAILFLDLLGVQKMWATGGAPMVRLRIDEFNAFVEEQLNFLPATIHRNGDYTVVLQGDSLAVMCQDFDQAIGMGIHFFVQAFYATDKMDRPFWLRGAISRWSNQYLTFNSVPVKTKGIEVGTRYANDEEYLAVLALEKSGFRGMRLLVDASLLSDRGKSFEQTWTGFHRPLRLVTKLRQCPYPAGENYNDVLWMASDEKRYEHLKGIMASRFKACTADPDEFAQAAWTRASFDQVESLVWLCRQAYSDPSPG